MSSKNFFRLALLIPYAGWIIAIPFVGKNLPEFINKSIEYYLVGIVCWGAPYALLALLLLKWSLNQESKTIFRIYLFSPIILAILISLILLIISIPFVLFSNGKIVIVYDFLFGIIAFTTLSLLYGYFFVGIGLLIYKYLKLKGKIQDGLLQNS